MKIAVTYDNGNVFGHFGRTEEFKVYTVENNEVISVEIIASNGAGHSALAVALADHDIDVLICGGIGQGAVNALSAADIQVVPGASGNTDEVVSAYLKGELETSGANCDHHHGEGEHCCGEHEEGHDCECGNGEGGEGCGCGGGCCGHHAPEMQGRNVGKTVHVHYRGTFNDGTQFDSSYDRGTTLDFVCGAGMMIRGFDQAVADMETGTSVDVHLMPEDAYGPADPNAIFTVRIDQLPGSEDLNKGDHVYLSDMYGRQIPVVVADKTDAEITFDANHEMAGKELNFHIELISVD